MPDGRLVQRVRAGDEAAFEVLFDRYHRPLLAFCRHMLGSREEAEDALQHVFVAAHKHLVGGTEIAELRPWLYTVARNRCLSVLRARREAVALDDVAEPVGAGLALAAEVEQRADLQAVLADLARLPDDQRAALVLSELGALSHEEIAGVLGVRREKVKALVFQGRESLAAWRQARDTDCRDIREQLANLRGSALRRGPLRRHLDTCEGCREFRDEVRRQREAMALLLPVVPSVALKAKVVGAVAASGLPAAAAVPVAGVGAGLAAKALVVAALAGTAGGGALIVDEQTGGERPRPATEIVAPAQLPGAADAVFAPAGAIPGTRPAAPAKDAPSSGASRQDRAAGTDRQRGQERAQERRNQRAAGPPAHSNAGGASERAPRGRRESPGRATAPGQATRPVQPARPPRQAPAQSRRPDTAPGQATGTGTPREKPVKPEAPVAPAPPATATPEQPPVPQAAQGATKKDTAPLD